MGQDCLLPPRSPDPCPGIHTHPRGGGGPCPPESREGEWHSPMHSFKGPADATSPGPREEEPLRIERSPGAARRVARRRGRRPRAEWARRIGHALLLEQARGADRRGQAPKGTGGMPRRHQDSGVEGCEKSGGAAQRASSPECPNRPRELKHLSTWRKGNQPRLPQ